MTTSSGAYKSTLDTAALTAAMDQATRHLGPHRAMAVTMECGHLRLMPQVNTVMGPGAITGCRMCGDDLPARMVVKIEETGVLHESYMPQLASGDSESTS